MHDRWVGLGALLLVAGLGAESFAGQVHIQQISLEEVVRATTIVVVASPADPAITFVDQPYEGKVPPGVKDVPVFRAGVQHYVVRSTAWPQGADAPAVGQRIDVWGVSTPSRRDDHYAYYVHGLRKHPIYPEYTPSYGHETPDPVLLLLSPRVEGGYWVHGTEVPARASEVVALQTPSAPAPTP